ncbi:MAG: sensor histidine kinase [Novosphingobium sp.]
MALYILIAIAAPTLVRLALEPFIHGRLPFTAYFPAVLLTAVFLGWRSATAVAIGAGIVGLLLFQMNSGPAWTRAEIILGLTVFVSTMAIIIATGDALRRAVRDLDAAVARANLLASELGHRAKNHLALIAALARQCHRTGQSSDEFFAALMPRIQALARAQDVLTRGRWTSCDLRELVEEVLKPFSHPGISMEGPEIRILPATCQALTMVLHELATNAEKYGALSLPAGKVSLRWTAKDSEGCVVRWIESDGPAVKPPERRGLGSRLISRHPAFAHVDFAFPPDGVTCTITLREGEASRKPAIY